MSAVLLATGLALLVLPGAAASLGRHLEPSEWRRLNRVAIRLGFVMFALGPLLAAVPLALDVAGVEAVAEVCHHLLGPVAPGAAMVGWASLSVSVAFFAVAGAAHRRSRRLQRAGGRFTGWRCGRECTPKPAREVTGVPGRSRTSAPARRGPTNTLGLPSQGTGDMLRYRRLNPPSTPYARYSWLFRIP